MNRRTVAAIASAVALCFAACATTGGTSDFEDNGISLHEAIEQSAEKICADLPRGSRVAIVAWESPNAGLSDYVMEELSGALVDRGMEVADRQNLEYVYRELNFQTSGDVSDETAQSIGKFLGAGMVITGQLTELGGPYRFRASAVHVETAARNSVSRFDVKGDAALRRIAAALAGQKTAVKTASYGEGTKPAVPGTAGAFLDRGITLASQGEFALAIEDFNEAIKLNANLGSAWLLRGRAYYASVSTIGSIGENFGRVITTNAFGQQLSAEKQQALDQAIADYTEAARLDGNNAVIYVDRGKAYNYRGEQDKALADFNQAIRLSPANAYAYNARGSLYSDKKDYDRAIADYTQAIKFDPQFFWPYNNRGLVYLNNKNDYDRAIADYTQAIRIDPNNSDGYISRGVAYDRKGDYDRAIADFETALRIDPNNTTAKNNLKIEADAIRTRGGTYYDKGDYDRAIADFTLSIRIDPSSDRAYNQRGNAYLQKEDYDRAISDYNQAIRLDPNEVIYKNNLALSYNRRGNAYYNQGNYDRAIADFNQAISLNPNSASPYINRGNAYNKKGDRTRARADWTKALQLDPNNTAARNNLANFQ